MLTQFFKLFVFPELISTRCGASVHQCHGWSEYNKNLSLTILDVLLLILSLMEASRPPLLSRLPMRIGMMSGFCGFDMADSWAVVSFFAP